MPNRAFVAWLNELPFGRRSRHFTVVQASPHVADDGPANPAAGDAPGLHIFWFAGRPMWLRREIALNLQVVETMHLGELFSSSQRMERLLECVARHASERRANLLTLYTVDRFGDEWRQAEISFSGLLLRFCPEAAALAADYPPPRAAGRFDRAGRPHATRGHTGST